MLPLKYTQDMKIRVGGKEMEKENKVCTCGKVHTLKNEDTNNTENYVQQEGHHANGRPLEKIKQILFDTRSVSGTTKSFSEKLGRSLGLPVYHINEVDFVEDAYILCTFTDGVGEVPKSTTRFLKTGNNAEYMQGVVANGSSNFKSTGLFGLAGDRIQADYGVHLYKKLDMGGTVEDVYSVAQRLNYDFKLGVTLNKKDFLPASTFKNGKFNFAPRKLVSEPQKVEQRDKNVNKRLEGLI